MLSHASLVGRDAREKEETDEPTPEKTSDDEPQPEKNENTSAAGRTTNMLKISSEVWSCSARSGAKSPTLFNLERPYK